MAQPDANFFTDERVFAIVSVIVGIIVGSLTSNLGEWLRFRRDTKHRESTQSKERSTEAQKGFVKLFLLQSAADSVCATIDRALEQQRGNLDMAPNQKFRGMIGVAHGLEKMQLGEVVFLFSSDRPTLFSDVISFERRVFQLGDHLEGYTSRRKDLLLQLEINASELAKGSPQYLTITQWNSLPIEVQRESNSLDLLLASIRKEAEECVLLGREYCDCFLKIARAHFGENFPENAVSWDKRMKLPEEVAATDKEGV